jgi:two-component system phosphate regulon sensor histidine kinase PhoR
MIDQVLTWRSAARDRRVLELKVAPLEGAVEKALERFSMLTGPEELDLTVDLEATTPVPHDADGITVVVLNLLVNAYKYSGEDPRIFVRVFDGDSGVVIEVEDNGIGIPRADRRRIFDPFYTVDSRLRGRSTGVGLGLAISRALVTAHNGSVEVDAREGGGSRFTVRLPLAGEIGATLSPDETSGK